ncbi:unnamed protein product [Lactuca virosa]|uniref:Uncharacterized protein n=1 Tax=Lactuca virosa TaxID=75947 RepID=A0AAU9PWB1_9ASTR|nr:unnamed protein product [Lactuca virosa]
MKSLEGALSCTLGILQGPILQFTKGTNCLVGDFFSEYKFCRKITRRIPTGISLASRNRHPGEFCFIATSMC